MTGSYLMPPYTSNDMHMVLLVFIAFHRFQLLKESEKRSKIDGLNTLNYTLLGIEPTKLYTRIYVQINETLIKEQYEHRQKQYFKTNK